MSPRRVLLTILLIGLALLVGAGKIKHVVVVMEENRSFDHIFGWYKKSRGFLNGSEYNLVNASDPNSKKVYVTKNAPYINLCDPDHSTPPTTFKIFGPFPNYSNPTMGGFAMFERDFKGHNSEHGHYCNVLDMFAPGKLPVITKLADEFVLMDRFFASHPGPTWPNRLFFLSATSAGLTETYPWYHNIPGKLFPQKTIFDQLEAANKTWKVYYNDTPWELFVEKIAHSPENTESMEQFYEDARTGNLPTFSYINPRSGINITLGQGSNDMHPDHDMAVGEAYYKDIYEALRSGPNWNDTLFVITFDEHGGFYDHVLTPLNIPPPDDGEASYPDLNFKFNRGGIRIPTLLISPWLPKGTVLSEPPEDQKPFPNSEYELTSIFASVRKLLGMDTTPLTKRDAWAATFEHLFDGISTPRTDCPVHLPNAPPPSKDFDEASRPLNELQHHIMTVHAHLSGSGAEFKPEEMRQRDVSEWVQKRYTEHKTLTMDWRASKLQCKYEVALTPYKVKEDVVSKKWVVNNVLPFPIMTLSTSIKEEGKHVEYCLDGKAVEGTPFMHLSFLTIARRTQSHHH